MLDLLKDVENVLLDYIERLEKPGGSMHYGRGVLARVQQGIRILGGTPRC